MGFYRVLKTVYSNAIFSCLPQNNHMYMHANKLETCRYKCNVAVESIITLGRALSR